MKLHLSVFFLLVTNLVLGQSYSNKLKVFCTDSFDPKVSITVSPPYNDDLALADALKNSLVVNGFKVISEAVAREQIEISNNKVNTDQTQNQEIKAGRSTYIKSVYLITFTYTYSEYMYHPNVRLKLNGQIVDLANDGLIVATFSFQKNTLATNNTRKVMDAIAIALSKKQKNR